MYRTINSLLAKVGLQPIHSSMGRMGQDTFRACRERRDGWEHKAEQFLDRAKRRLTLGKRKRQLLRWAIISTEECLRNRDQIGLVKAIGYSLHNFHDFFDETCPFKPASFPLRSFSGNWEVCSAQYKSLVSEMTKLSDEELNQKIHSDNVAS